jgi:hypothetical protein
VTFCFGILSILSPSFLGFNPFYLTTIKLISFYLIISYPQRVKGESEKRMTEQKPETKSITAVLEVPTETYDWLQEKADAQGVDIGQVVAELIGESAPSTLELPELPEDLKEPLTAIANAKNKTLAEYWAMLKPDVQEALIRASEKPEPKQEIEFENVTIKVPKLIMDFLRGREKDMDETAKEYIEYNVVQIVNSDIRAGDVFVLDPEELADSWKLNPIFKAIINDEIT